MNLPFDINRIFDPKLIHFDELADMAYHHQCNNNAIFKDYVSHLNVAPSQKYHFLPVTFFKTHNVISGAGRPQITFTSSATSGLSVAKHQVLEIGLYESSFKACFELFYGNPADYCILALLPAYLERTGSSLVYMAEYLIKASGHSLSGFYLNDFEMLFDTLIRLKKQKVILLGVTFALLDFAESYALHFPELIIMETGGMKGRRKELTRDEVHQQLKEAFGVAQVHSEYGMTELLSQAYASGNGKFYCPPWMKVYISDPNDPLTFLPPGKSGLINIIDLANIHSCSFIQTSDIGRINADGSFEILGRMDQSDLRGCSLLYL